MKTKYGIYGVYDATLQAWKAQDALMVNLSDDLAVLAFVRSLLAIKDPIERSVIMRSMRFYRLGFIDVDSPTAPLVSDLYELTNAVITHDLLISEVEKDADSQTF